MNAKRIAAVFGLVCIAVTVLSIVLSAFLPAYHELTLSVGGLSFLLAATVLGILKYRDNHSSGDSSEEE